MAISIPRALLTSAALPFGQTEVSPEYEEKISGLMPANIYLTTDIANLDIDGGTGDTFNVSYAGTTSPAWQIFAGLQTTVNLIPSSFSTPSPEIYGATERQRAVLWEHHERESDQGVQVSHPAERSDQCELRSFRGDEPDDCR